MHMRDQSGPFNKTLNGKCLQAQKVTADPGQPNYKLRHTKIKKYKARVSVLYCEFIVNVNSVV